MAVVTLSNKRLSVYSANIEFNVELFGIRYFLYHWWFTTSIFFISLFTFVSCLCFSPLLYYSCLQISSCAQYYTNGNNNNNNNNNNTNASDASILTTNTSTAARTELIDNIDTNKNKIGNSRSHATNLNKKGSSPTATARAAEEEAVKEAKAHADALFNAYSSKYSKYGKSKRSSNKNNNKTSKSKKYDEFDAAFQQIHKNSENMSKNIENNFTINQRKTINFSSKNGNNKNNYSSLLFNPSKNENDYKSNNISIVNKNEAERSGNESPMKKRKRHPFSADSSISTSIDSSPRRIGASSRIETNDTNKSTRNNTIEKDTEFHSNSNDDVSHSRSVRESEESESEIPKTPETGNYANNRNNGNINEIINKNGTNNNQNGNDSQRLSIWQTITQSISRSIGGSDISPYSKKDVQSIFEATPLQASKSNNNSNDSDSNNGTNKHLKTPEIRKRSKKTKDSKKSGKNDKNTKQENERNSNQISPFSGNSDSNDSAGNGNKALKMDENDVSLIARSESNQKDKNLISNEFSANVAKKYIYNICRILMFCFDMYVCLCLIYIVQEMRRQTEGCDDD